jgi:predicted enzyme related to lactoylglutathione lyase
VTDLPFDALITFVPCRSLERSVTFYGDALGCRVVVEQPGCTILRCSSTGYIGVCERPEEVGSADGVVLTFVTDDVDAVAAAIRQAGATITIEPRRNVTYGIYQCFATDPDGNVIEIQRFDDPGWGT